MNQNSAPLDVPQKLIPQTGARTCALNEAGNVSHHERTTILVRYHSQVWDQRGERISGDLRTCARDPGNQRALTRVGKPHQTDVRQQLELQDQLPFLARRPFLCEPRGLPRGSGKIHVAETPPPSFCDSASLPWGAEIAQLRAGDG